MNANPSNTECMESRLVSFCRVVVALMIVLGVEQFFSRCSLTQRELVYLFIRLLLGLATSVLVTLMLFSVCTFHWRTRRAAQTRGAYLECVITAICSGFVGCVALLFVVRILAMFFTKRVG